MYVLSKENSTLHSLSLRAIVLQILHIKYTWEVSV